MEVYKLKIDVENNSKCGIEEAGMIENSNLGVDSS